MRSRKNFETENCRKSISFNKGFTQMDYVIAVGIFIVVFALVIQTVSNYFTDAAQNTNLRLMTSEATKLLEIADNDQVWAQSIDRDVLLYMHLDNSTLDSSFYGNNGTNQNGVDCTNGIAGRVNGACGFDRLDDFIRVEDKDMFNFTASMSFTVEGWFNANITGNYAIAAKQFSNALPGWSLITFFGTMATRLDDGTNRILITSNGNVSKNNTWYHAALVVDRQSNKARIYVNGILFNNTDISTIGSLTNTQPVRIGNRDPSTGLSMSGFIDEVVIWNRTRTQEEIYSSYLDGALGRTGLSTKAYRIDVRVNNTQQYWYNQALPWESISNELVRINFTDYGISADANSTAVYDDSGNSVTYGISGSVITFTANVPTGVTRNYTVYFDDDSTFTSQSVAQSGVDNLSEIVSQAQKIDLLQYRKVSLLNTTNYTFLLEQSGFPRNFRISIIDNDGTVFSQLGGDVPNAGNIIALRRFVLFQNSTGGIRRGYLNVQVW